MGKSSKPLIYLVHPSLEGTPEIQDRLSKGHVITFDDIFLNYDAVIGPTCYRISSETVNLLDLVEKSIRATKYPPKEKVK